MGFWQIAGIVMVAVVLVFVLMFLVVKKIIDNIFKRVERPNYSSLLQFKDVKKEYPQELLRFQSGKNMLQGFESGVSGVCIRQYRISFERRKKLCRSSAGGGGFGCGTFFCGAGATV